MRRIPAVLALLVPALSLLPAAASAGQASASLTVGVTVVAACPPGSGRPCSQPLAGDGSPSDAGSAAGRSEPPIAVLRDENARTLTYVY
ncbi:hypothetical protein [Geminicoccus roseus]|uniref:hypothetical protein n=1 Tax=Geminicoccus roseus TaxID=404900 RepID=UPI000424F91B|nr:hypothetical protein [Geminicoccus roseus]